MKLGVLAVVAALRKVHSRLNIAPAPGSKIALPIRRRMQ